MESSRLTAYYSSLIHSPKTLKLQDFGVFPWENEKDYSPRFTALDKEAFDRLNALEFSQSDN
jgi:hypothetical protein